MFANGLGVSWQKLHKSFLMSFTRDFYSKRYWMLLASSTHNIGSMRVLMPISTQLEVLKDFYCHTRELNERKLLLKSRKSYIAPKMLSASKLEV